MVIIWYFEKCLRSLRISDIWLKSFAFSETLGSFYLYVWSAVLDIRFDTFGLSTRVLLTFATSDKNLRLRCKAFYRLLLSDHLFLCPCVFRVEVHLSVRFAFIEVVHYDLLWVKYVIVDFEETRSVCLWEYLWKVIWKPRLFEKLKN